MPKRDSSYFASISEVKAYFYHHWLLRCPLKSPPAVPVGSYVSGYFNMYSLFTQRKPRKARFS